MISWISKTKKYFSLVKFSHTIFAMPFAILGFSLGIFIEEKNFTLKLFSLVILCMMSARNIAMAFNRLVDADIDKKNERTAQREIPTGVISITKAFWFILFNMVLFYIATYLINALCFYLSSVALIVIMGYSLTKRFTFLCHIILGVGLALAPVGAFLAITSYFTFYIILLGFVVLFWVSGFDIIYALQDYEFDKKNKLFSLPVFLGIEKARYLSIAFHCITLILLIIIGLLLHRTFLYYGACCFFGIFLFRQHQTIDIKNLQKIEMSFFTNNGIASIVFCAIIILEFVLLGV